MMIGNFEYRLSLFNSPDMAFVWLEFEMVIP